MQTDKKNIRAHVHQLLTFIVGSVQKVNTYTTILIVAMYCLPHGIKKLCYLIDKTLILHRRMRLRARSHMCVYVCVFYNTYFSTLNYNQHDIFEPKLFINWV